MAAFFRDTVKRLNIDAWDHATGPYGYCRLRLWPLPCKGHEEN